MFEDEGLDEGVDPVALDLDGLDSEGGGEGVPHPLVRGVSVGLPPVH